MVSHSNLGVKYLHVRQVKGDSGSVQQNSDHGNNVILRGGDSISERQRGIVCRLRYPSRLQAAGK